MRGPTSVYVNPMGVAVTRAGVGKDISIESLRGVAIILMVAGHVIGSDVGHGMQVADDSAWRFYYLALEDMRMPLFTVLSGFVYAYRPLGSLGGYPQLVRGKVRRLLVPLFTVGTVFFLTQRLVPGTNQESQLADIWQVYILGYGHLWFVQSIFLIFLVVGVLDAMHLLSNLSQSLVWVVLSSLLFVVVTVPAQYDVFSVNGAVRLLPFFLLGYTMHRHAAFFTPRNWVLLTLVVSAGAVAYSLRTLTLLSDGSYNHLLLRGLIVVVGLFAVTILIMLRHWIRSDALARLGNYAYTIYLLHVFGSAGMRIVLERLPVHGEVVVFLACMIAALGLPVLFERVFGRFAVVSWGVIGQRPERRPRQPRIRQRVDISHT